MAGLGYAQQVQLLALDGPLTFGRPIQADGALAGLTSPEVQKSTGGRREEGEVLDLGTELVEGHRLELGRSGRGPYDVIQDSIEDVSEAVSLVRNVWLEAIGWLWRGLAISSASDLESDLVSEVLLAALEGAWDLVKDVLPIQLGKVTDFVIGLHGAAQGEIERLNEARDTEALRGFVDDVTRTVEAHHASDVAALRTELREELRAQYESFDSAAPIETDSGPVAVGAAADFLRNLTLRARAALRVSANPSVRARTQQRLLRDWITSPGLGGRSTPGRLASNGRIYVHFVARAGSVFFRDARLTVGRDEEDTVALANELMAEQGLSIADLGVPMIVGIEADGREHFFGDIRVEADLRLKIREAQAAVAHDRESRLTRFAEPLRRLGWQDLTEIRHLEEY